MCKISVLIPAYNTSEFIGECIESVTGQTFINIEIIIVDDGSDDKTVDIARQYAMSDDRIKIISTHHQGVAEARNECLKYATGEYILFVDSDDWIGPTICAELYSRAKLTSADIVFSTMIIAKPDGTETEFGDRSIVFNDSDVLTGAECFIKMVETNCTYPMVAGNLYRRDLFEKNNIVFKGEFHEDEYSFPFLLKRARNVCNLTSAQYFYRQRQKSIMNSASILKERAISLGAIVNEFENELMVWESSTAYRRFVKVLSKHITSLRHRSNILYDKYITNSKKPLIIVLTEKSISSNYGIGTYVRHISDTISDMSWDILHIELNAYDKSQQDFSVKNGLPCYTFPMCKAEGNDNQKKYQTGVFYYLSLRVGNGRKIICHANAYNYDHLVNLFRERLNAKTIFTVHYMDWAFQLHGNREEFERILASPNRMAEDSAIVASFEKEKRFLNDSCDYVIAIAKHSYETLNQIYKLPKDKLHLIYNSAAIPHRSTILSKASLREKYGFAQTDKIIIFAGRIDYGKGIFDLADAFRLAYYKNPNLRLIIAGDGIYSYLYKRLKPIWSKVCLTGYVDAQTLYELYRLSDLGIVPSLHEEFGYVAAEMATAGLPTVVNPKGGLIEISAKNNIVSVLGNPEDGKLADSIYSYLTNEQSSQKGAKGKPGLDTADAEFSITNLKSIYDSLFLKC